MGYEMAIRCDVCGQLTPSLKMKCTVNVPYEKIGQFIYEHAHCVTEYDFEEMKFSRISEDQSEWCEAPIEWIMPK